MDQGFARDTASVQAIAAECRCGPIDQRDTRAKGDADARGGEARRAAADDCDIVFGDA